MQTHQQADEAVPRLASPMPSPCPSPSLEQGRRMSRISFDSAYDSRNGGTPSKLGTGSNRPHWQDNGHAQPSQMRPHAHRFERLLVVRAVPTKTRHPLDLQVQALAPPQSHSTEELARSNTIASSFNAVAEASVDGQQQSDGRRSSIATPILTTTSVDSPTEEPPTAASTSSTPAQSGDEDDRALTLPFSGDTLSRSASLRSTRSNRSSAGSMSSIASGSARRIYPLYNLEFHALHHSVVTDAGTDERVARIHKRGVEVLDFAMMDPILYGQHRDIPTLAQRREEARKIAERARSSSSSSFAQDFKPSNLMNKFKRFSFKSAFSSSSGSPSSQPQSSPSEPSLTASTSSSNKRPSLLRSAASEITTVAGVPIVPLFRDKSESNQTFGFAKNSLEAIAPQPTKHAPGYVWLVRSFTRKDLAESTDLCEITLEWRKKRRRKGDSRRTVRSQATGGTDSRRSSVHFEEDARPMLSSSLSRRANASALHNDGTPPRAGRSFDRPRPTSMIETSSSGIATSQTHLHGSPANNLEDGLAARMLSPNRLMRPPSTPQDALRRSMYERSQSPVPSLGRAPSVSDAGHGGEEDDGNDSEPEDSETPWICELVIRRQSVEDTSLPPVHQRVLLGTVTPAPHHPKLVAHLAIPHSLTPVNIGNKGTLTIGIEEMKDMMTVTGLWLIVRESLGLGGLKARKNEGSWRLMEPAALRGDK